MGISATVLCRDYPEGRTTPCPFPEHFHYDPAAAPALDLPYADNEEAHATFREWLLTCCDHPNMIYAQEFIAGWRAYRVFAEVLEDLGTDAFPLLNRELPDGEDGLTTPQRAAQMLAEIERFEALETVGEQAVLVDDERGEDMSVGSDVMGGALTMDRVSGYDVGFDESGFFVRDRWELNRLLFHARHVEQRLIHPENLQVEYVNRDSGATFLCSVPLGKSITGEDGTPRMYLQLFSVELRPMGPSRFVHITGPLKRILQASIEVGNPIRWG